MRWLVRGDLDGFFGLALDNLVQLLLVEALCRTVLGFPPELVNGRVLPGAAVSILVGNLFYAWQAMQLARRTGRTDVCALPYGINTVSLFAHVFLVMLPAKLAAQAAGAADPSRVAWGAGLLACLASGLMELPWRVRRGARAEGDPAGGAPVHARRDRARLHLARVPVPDVRASRRRSRDARRS